jgi:hypothetical protein
MEEFTNEIKMAKEPQELDESSYDSSYNLRGQLWKIICELDETK